MNMRDWRALSIQQPWIDLILRGVKTIEVRNWRMEVRGPILLHASAAVDWRAIELFGYSRPRELPRGKLVGYAEIGETFEFERSWWLSTADRHLVLRPLGQGNYGSYIENVHAFARPVPCRGRLLLFPIPENAVPQTRAELEALDIAW